MTKEELKEDIIKLLKEKINKLEQELLLEKLKPKLPLGEVPQDWRNHLDWTYRPEQQPLYLVEYNYIPTAYCFKGNKSIIVIN